MGMFSTKKKIYVSSSSYNLAGDFEIRQEFLKTTVFSHIIMAPADASMADSITRAYLSGPGIQFNRFERWSENSGYETALGTVASSISVGVRPNVDTIIPQLPDIDPDQTVIVDVAEIDSADMDYWVDQYILANHPEILGTEFAYDVDEETNEVIINFEGGGYTTFIPSNYFVNTRYLYVYYFVSQEMEAEPIEIGSTIVLDAIEPFPDVTDWTELSYSDVAASVDLDTTIEEEVTYSDATPPEYYTNTTTSTDSYNEIHGEWTVTNYIGSSPENDSLRSLKENQYHDQVGIIVPVVTIEVVEEDIGGGVIKTTTTTTTEETLVLDRTYRIDTQVLIDKKWSNTKVFIYPFGSGNLVLDSLFAEPENSGRFFPYIPIRLNNRFISPTYLPATYELAKKAVKKSVGGKFDAIVDSLKENESLGDIDYAYLVFGVSLNAKDNACKKYVYNFFEKVILDASTDPEGNYSAWQIAYDNAIASSVAWANWKEAQADEMDPLFGTPEPVVLKTPVFPNNRISIRSTNNSVMNYNIIISWSNLFKETGTGLYKAGAKKGEVFIEKVLVPPPEIAIPFLSLSGIGGLFASLIFKERNAVKITYQKTTDTWESIIVYDLNHKNTIYGGKAVNISGPEAIDDEEESGFIIPMHVNVWKTMSLIDRTQMSTQCSHLVLNSYKVVKTKWYRRGIFKVVVIIVVIIIAVVFALLTGGAGTPLSLALIQAVIVQTLVTIIVLEIISRAVILIFGDKIGAIINTIIAVAAIAMGRLPPGTAASASATMATAQHILKLTMAVGDGIASYMQAVTNDLVDRTQAVSESYERRSKEINEAYKKLMGANEKFFNPMALIDSTNSLTYESLDSFLGRTLMTGSDVVEMSLGLVNDFVNLSINTELT